MQEYATLGNQGNYTIFHFRNDTIRFRTSVRLERYTHIVEWDHGYIVGMAKYQNIGEVEEYIDLVPILRRLNYDVHQFLAPIKEVRIKNAV